MTRLKKLATRHALVSRAGTYLTIDVVAGVLVLVIYMASNFFPVNHGVFIAVLEVLTSFAVVSFLVSNSGRLREIENRLFLFSYAFLLTGDLLYGYLYYWLGISRPTQANVLLHEIPLSLSYFLLSVTLVYCLRKSIRQIVFHPFFIVPLLIVLPLMFRFVFPLASPVGTTTGLLVWFVEIFSLVSTLTGLVLSLVIFVFSREMFWSVFSLGVMTSYISGLGIRIDRLSGSAVQFNGFECLWAFGGLVSALAVIFLSSEKNEIHFSKERSIVFSTRMMGLVVAFASTVILSLLHWRDLESVQTIVYMSVISFHIAGVLGHYLWDRLVECSNSIEQLFRVELSESLAVSSAIPIEMSELYAQTLRSRVQEFKKTSELKQEVRIAKQIQDEANQVVHDLRSPLTVLEICAQEIPSSENHQRLLRGSITRLKDITNKLSRRAAGKPKIENRESSIQMLSLLVEELIAEKKVQYRSNPEIEIEIDLSKAFEIFVLVNPVEFKRLLSNVIDNSAEAIRGKGKIMVSLLDTENHVECHIKDNGPGIAGEILPKLGDKGASFGKPKGQGLGLYHAKTSVESWGGKFSIESRLGYGTSVKLILPKVPGLVVENSNVSFRRFDV